MIFEENYIYAGKILKSHGYKGQMLVSLEDFAQDILETEEYIFPLIEGLYVPFFITEFYIKTPPRAIISMQDIESDTDCEDFIGLDFYIADKNRQNTRSFSSNQNRIIGLKVEDTTSGTSGEITDFMDVPGNPLINLKTSTNEFLIPFNEEFIVDLNEDENLLTMKLPQGIFDF